MDFIHKVKPGDKLVLSHPQSGYITDQQRAQHLIETFGENPVFTLKYKDIDNWHTGFYFEEIEGRYNSVHFTFAEEVIE